VRPRGLIDAGALIALVDEGDRWHPACRAGLAQCSLPLATTAAVLAEFLHYFVKQPSQFAACWRLLRSGAVTILPITDDDAGELERLMLKYADRPMDFADATLVRVAERERLTTILTVDRDFEVYRIGGRKGFRVVPGR
jgi:predicted nucleic acid-binding protein